jgi:4-amino-4-deoxy-L-arabinose transferase-like glycosyltransferase
MQPASVTAGAGSASRDGSRVAVALCAAAIVLGYFAFLGHAPLAHPDEGRYAEVAREMIDRGDFITPHLNYVKYFDKPALHYWLNAAAFAVFGQNEFAARFSGVVAALSTILATFLLGRRLWGPRAGLAAAWVLAASPLWFVAARIDTVDPVFSSLSALSMMALLAAADCREVWERRRWLACFYVLAGLATLAKGLIAVVFPAAMVGLTLLATRQLPRLRELGLLWGVPLYLFVTAPWFVAASVRNPDFAWFFFVHEHFIRYTSGSHARGQPFWFFFAIGLAGVLPFTAWLLPALRDPLRSAWRERLREPTPELYLCVWSAFIFLFFSASSSKLPFYILPICPALALLLGRWAARQDSLWDPEAWPRGYRGCLAGVTALAGLVLLAPLLMPRIVPHVGSLGEVDPAALWAIALPASLIAALFVALARGIGRRLAAGPLPFLACAVVAVGVGAIEVGRVVDAERAALPLSLAVKELAAPEDGFAQYRHYQQNSSFYTGRRAISVDYLGALEFGYERAADRDDWFWTPEHFLEQWRGSRRFWLLLDASKMADTQPTGRSFEEELAPFAVVGRSGELLLVTQAPAPGLRGTGSVE